MNKDLEKEYKELMSADAPDLWAKIEAGLEPKQPNVKRKNRIKSMSVWGALAAACLCLVISVPVLFGGRKGSFADGGMTGGNMSPAENYENAGSADVWEKDISASAAEDDTFAAEGTAGDETFVSGIITAEVNKIWGEGDRTVFTVEIKDIYSAEADYLDFSEGDAIDLYDVNDFYKKSYKDLKEGNIYTFEIVVQIDDSDAAKYWIINIQ